MEGWRTGNARQGGIFRVKHYLGEGISKTYIAKKPGISIRTFPYFFYLTLVGMSVVLDRYSLIIIHTREGQW